HVPLVTRHAIYHQALSVVRVHGVGSHSDAVFHRDLTANIVLRHDILAHESPRFTHIELMRPAARIQELVTAVTPAAHLVTDMRGHTGIRSDEVQEPLLI